MGKGTLSDAIMENSKVVSNIYEGEDVKDASELKDLVVCEYLPAKRDPSFSESNKSAIWELTLLSKHCHPTINKWATMLLNDEYFVYRGICLSYL